MHFYLSIFTHVFFPESHLEIFREDLPPTLFPLFFGEFPSLLGQLKPEVGRAFQRLHAGGGERPQGGGKQRPGSMELQLYF